nr:hypothetical protein [Micromonospora sp. DSM 115978]
MIGGRVTCILCPVYWPDHDPHPADLRRVCEQCQPRPAAHLAQIARRYDDLPAALEPSRSPHPHLTGSREPAAPLRLAVADLLTPVVRPNGRPVDSTTDTLVPHVPAHRGHLAPVTIAGRRIMIPLVSDRPLVTDDPVLVPAGDQIGNLPVKVVLDQWARAIRAAHDHRPPRTVHRRDQRFVGWSCARLCGWITDQLGWASSHYDAYPDLAESLRDLLTTIKGALGEVDPPPERCVGVPCDRCERPTLWRRDDGFGTVECRRPDCRRVLTAADYRDWTHTLGIDLANDPDLVDHYRAYVDNAG